MKNLLLTIPLLITLCSIHAQNISPPAGQSNSLAPLTGKWAITSATTLPLIIIPLCKPVLQGTIFKFTDKELQVFTDTAAKSCGVYNFKITANTISIIKADMIWLCTYELDTNQLKIKSNNFFSPYQSGKSSPVNKQQPLMNEIEVTLIKHNN